MNPLQRVAHAAYDLLPMFSIDTLTLAEIQPLHRLSHGLRSPEYAALVGSLAHGDAGTDILGHMASLGRVPCTPQGFHPHDLALALYAWALALTWPHRTPAVLARLAATPGLLYGATIHGRLLELQAATRTAVALRL